MRGLFAVGALVLSWGSLYAWDRWRSVRERWWGPDETLAARYGGSVSWSDDR